MAYDVHLADRVRELLVEGSPVTEPTSREFERLQARTSLNSK